MSVLIIGINSVERVALPESEDAQYQLLRDTVGGDIEIVYPPVAGVHAYINGEGKFDGLAPNPLATRLMGGNLLPNDIIVGPMIILASGPDGAEAPLSDEHYADLLQLVEPSAQTLPAVWKAGADFAEVAEVVGVPTDAVIGWGKNVLPSLRPGIDAVVWTEGDEIWTCALERDSDGILRRVEGTLKQKGTLADLIASVEARMDEI